MARSLLIRGMLAGVIAAILATLFARLVAEPQIDLAIAFEAAHQPMHHAMDAAMGGAEEPELVSRATQKGVGLLTAVGLYGAAVGGIFALVFALLYGRVARIGPRSLALLLAAGAFVAVALVPALQYPPTPPAVGQHETVGFRTLAYFAMIGASIAGLVLSIKAARGLAPRIGGFNAMLAGAGIYVLLMIAVQMALPVINEVPDDYPATLLWQFRVGSIGMQAVLWSAIGILFGILAERLFMRRPARP